MKRRMMLTGLVYKLRDRSPEQQSALAARLHELNTTADPLVVFEVRCDVRVVGRLKPGGPP